MHIEQELRNWLATNIPETRTNKPRNTRIVLDYYGFGDLPWPTLEEIAIRFSLTRERVRQIITDSFKREANTAQLPIASAVFDAIERHELAPVSELRVELMDQGLASADTTIQGVLHLAHDLGRCNGYHLYDSSLRRVVRSEAEFESNTSLVNPNVLSELRSGLRQARTLPGLLGLARFEDLRTRIENAEIAERVISFVNESPDAVKVNAGDERWYVYEDRDNTLLNACGKIRSVSERLDIDVLSSTLRNALRRRSPGPFSFPQVEVISEWIESSRWFRVDGKSVEFLGEKRDLAEIEQAVVEYLSSVDYSLCRPLKEDLLAKGYSTSATATAIMASPLVAVDKSGQRTKYTYTLISKAGTVRDRPPQALNRYQGFRNRLKTLLAAGTDVHGVSLSRREQAILREWLFGDDVESHCAICGRRFSVSALVAAHKKRRSICSESERVDPYIVFPLCVFGCDHLYESGALKILRGEVVAGKVRRSDAQDMVRVQELVGRELHEDWLRGDVAYFEG